MTNGNPPAPGAGGAFPGLMIVYKTGGSPVTAQNWSCGSFGGQEIYVPCRICI